MSGEMFDEWTPNSRGNKILQQKVVGGVTLNHLAWAAQVGGKLISIRTYSRKPLTKLVTYYWLLSGSYS